MCPKLFSIVLSTEHIGSEPKTRELTKYERILHCDLILHPMTKKKISDIHRSPTPIELIERHIYLIRGHKVMLSTHLAGLYSVEPRVLVQAVKRNIDRFPKDFMFQLSDVEFNSLKSQFVTSSWGGPRRTNPYAFTEHGVAMLSSVLRNQRAVKMNILERSGTVIAIALTSRPQQAGFPLTLPLQSRNLPKTSRAKISQIRTLSVERIGSRIGRATAEEMTQIVDGLNEIIGT